MESAVESLFVRGDGALHDVLPRLETFMDHPVRVGALTLAFFSLADKTAKAQFSFTHLHREWDRLLGRMAGKGDRATRIRGESGFELNENDIRRYVFREHKPQNLKRKTALLALLAAHEIERYSLRKGPRTLIATALETFDFADPIINFLETGNDSVLDPQQNEQAPEGGKPSTPPAESGVSPADTVPWSQLKPSDLEGVANKALRAVLKVGPTDQTNIARWFFNESVISNLTAKPDRSYYALYRYSTQLPEIVKTLLVIDSPALSGHDCFTFVHVYYSKPGKLKRITRGTVLGFPRSFYFIGMSAQVLKGRDPLSRPAIDQPEGLKLIAIPASEAQAGYDLLPGVFMSNSLKWQPLVGRLALVHIGFESVVGPLSDDNREIRPSILPGPKALANDLRMICSLPNSTPREENTDNLAKRILTRINNRPFCDQHRPGLADEGVTRALVPENEQTPDL